MIIEVNNLVRTFKGESLLKKYAREVLEGEGVKDKAVSFVVVGEKRMKEMNKKYRKKDKPTDVLSFPFLSSFPKEGRDLGEIVICPKQIKKGELQRTVIHGILHILSYDHKSKKDAEIMKEKEDYYIKQKEK